MNPKVGVGRVGASVRRLARSAQARLIRVRRLPTRSKRWKRTTAVQLVFNPITLTVATIGVALLLYAASAPLLEAIELNWLDLHFRSRGPQAPHPAIVLATIDEKSLASEGRWPWPRSRIAALVDALSKDGAKVIAFDVTFPEPDDNSRLNLVNELAGKAGSLGMGGARFDEFITAHRRDADTDLALVNALRRSTAAIVLGYFFHIDDSTIGFELDKGTIERRWETIAPSKYPLVYSASQDGDVPYRKAYSAQTNLAVFTNVAASSGYFSVATDRDGGVRWMPLMVQAGDDLFPPLSVLSAWHYLGKPQLAVHAGEHEVEGVELGPRFIPTDEHGQLLINYRGPARTFPHYSISDILSGELVPGVFKDKIVIIGATALGIGDLRNTPFAHVYPGPEIHATVIDNILTGDFLSRPSWSKAFDVLAIVLLGIAVGVALPRMQALAGLMFAGALFVLYVLVTHLVFVSEHIWLSLVYPLFALSTSYTAQTAYRYLTEERERRRIKDTFKYYVSGEVIEDVLSDPDRLKLGGQEKLLTVVFSDLVGFTTYSEPYPPREIIQILSEYYERMTEQVFANHGTLTNYIGDELMAIFGAPVDLPNHAMSACGAALDMLTHRDALAIEWEKIGRPRLRARTGINSGLMLVGNVGSKYRFAYTVLGDNVNLASRLEQLNRFYGTDIIVSQSTARLAEAGFVMRRLDNVRVVGRHQSLWIYELIARGDIELLDEHRRLLGNYAAGLEAYLERRWADALALFAECRNIKPDDGPSRVMLARCQAYQTSPPPDAWDGTFDHVSKGGG